MGGAAGAVGEKGGAARAVGEKGGGGGGGGETGRNRREGEKYMPRRHLRERREF